MELVWILGFLGGFLGYWILVAALDARGVLERYNASAAGPLLMFRTGRGRDLLDRLARPKRFWRAYANVGVAVAGLVMVASFVLLLRIAHLSIFQTPEPTQITEPQNVLVIPGINDFLPLSVAPEILAGLLIGIVVHELGHGILCRVGDIGVSSMGAVMLAVIPFGAFVEPDEEEVESASSGDRTRMFAAGVTNNFVLTVVAFVLIALSLSAVQPLDGVGVQNVAGDSLADGVVEQGDRVVAVDGEEVGSTDAFFSALGESDGEEVVLTVASKDGETRDERLETGEPGVEVSTVESGSAADDAGMQEGDIITAVDGEEVTNAEEFVSAMGALSPGDEATFEVRRDGETEALDATVGEHPRGEGAFLGVGYLTNAQRVGVTPYDIGTPYSLLTSFDPIDWVLAIYLPLGAAIGVSPFFGFEGFILEFYELTGPAAALGGAYWVVPNVLYWTAWVNFNLGLFNCIPALPLDGGHILKEGLKKAVSPVASGEEREHLADSLSIAVAVAMFGSMLLMIVAPRLL
ncbi:MAG: site-2 protease family protein [Halobacteriales archaeon]